MIRAVGEYSHVCETYISYQKVLFCMTDTITVLYKTHTPGLCLFLIVWLHAVIL